MWYPQGMYMQVGDIVSMLDMDGGTYYAQVRGFLTDQYCEKSAVVTWLLPTKASPPPEQCFDPATYIIGMITKRVVTIMKHVLKVLFLANDRVAQLGRYNYVEGCIYNSYWLIKHYRQGQKKTCPASWTTCSL